MQNSILFKLLPEMFEVQTNFWNPTFPVSNCSYSYDQRNAVVGNSVIEKPSFRLVNSIVRIYLSGSCLQ